MLAIVIPYYKITFFEATLQSLANQTNQQFKVYIGDDASLENPSILLAKFKGQFNFKYHRFEENLGSTSLTKQWERCISLSGNEEWLMILGDDDVLGENVVSSWYGNYELFNEKSEVIRFSSIMMNEKTNSFTEIFEHPIWEKSTDSFRRKYEHQTRSSLSEYIFSKCTYKKYGFYNYPLAWNSDDRAWLDFSDNKPIFTINDSVVYFRLSLFNISGKADNMILKNESEIAFYEYLIRNKLKYYNKEFQHKVLRRFESKVINSRPLKISEWFFLFYNYIRFFDLNAFKKFLKRHVK